MTKVSNEDFLKDEDLTIVSDCWVSGKFAKKGSVITVSGNDKMQLLASGKAKRPDEETTKPVGKGAEKKDGPEPK